MSSPTTPHPSAADLDSLAQEKLSGKKTQRILDHCKQCPPCADQLMEAVREQTPATPLKLTKWNWISIGFLIVWLLATLVALWWISRGTPQLPEAPIGAETEQQVWRTIVSPQVKNLDSPQRCSTRVLVSDLDHTRNRRMV
jgi:hypothetical protein